MHAHRPKTPSNIVACRSYLTCTLMRFKKRKSCIFTSLHWNGWKQCINLVMKLYYKLINTNLQTGANILLEEKKKSIEEFFCGATACLLLIH